MSRAVIAILLVHLYLKCVFAVPAPPSWQDSSSATTTQTTASVPLLSKEYHDYTPTHLWQLDSAHHGPSVNSHTIYAHLHDVQHAPGPYNPYQNGSLAFKGTPSSYVEIPNNGDLNATTVFSWVMLVQPKDMTNIDSVILEYWDDQGGIRLMQSATDLVVEAHVASNSQEVLRLEVNDVLELEQWKFLTLTFMGFTKRKLKLIYADFNDTSTDKEEMSVDDGTVLRGTGNVRLGASSNVSISAFSGNIACLRYYDAYVGKYQSGYLSSCDPQSLIFGSTLDSLSEHTLDYPDSSTTESSSSTTALTAMQGTTASAAIPAAGGSSSPQQTMQGLGATTATGTSTSGTTTSSTTTTVLTSTATTTPSSTTMSTTAVTSWSTLAETSTTTANSSIVSALVDTTLLEAYTVEDTCVEMIQDTGLAGTVAFTVSHPMAFETDNLGACAAACLSTCGCSSVALEKQVKDSHVTGECVLGGVNYTIYLDSTLFHIFYIQSGLACTLSPPTT